MTRRAEERVEGNEDFMWRRKKVLMSSTDWNIAVVSLILYTVRCSWTNLHEWLSLHATQEEKS